jgi:hypothetical protein
MQIGDSSDVNDVISHRSSEQQSICHGDSDWSELSSAL